MTTKQISVFVENKPGSLSAITAALEKVNIDIRALCIADTADYGILRLIVNNPRKAYDALKAEGFTVSFTDVLAVPMNDEPGSLSKVLKCLADAEVNVEYTYAFLTNTTGFACLILRAEDSNKAFDTLTKNGIKVICGPDVYQI